MSVQAEKKISAIILCAGRGSRMGGQLKALLPLAHDLGSPNPHTFLDEIVSRLSDIPFEEILIVTGFESHRVRDHLALREPHPKIKLTNNSLYVTGMFRSIKSGIKGLSKNTDAVMIILVDQPFIAKQTYEKVYQSYISGNDKSLWKTYFDQQPGHPVIIGSDYFQQILNYLPNAAEREQGCQFLFRQNKNQVAEVHVDDPMTILDFDTESDLSTKLAKSLSASRLS
ncbi:MAG: NTP transferase domain-containing protein [Pseudobdellovibrionaceae bacterium]